jgi:hypothetical protein
MSTQLFGGAQFEMSARRSATTPAVVVDRLSAEDGALRLDQLDANGTPTQSMIFQGDEMVIVNHGEKTYLRITEKSVSELAKQMEKATAAMKQMQEQLANMPLQQRQMMEKMFKGKMPGMPAAVPAIRLEKGDAGNFDSYSRNYYKLFIGDEFRQQMCAASADQVTGSEELMAAAKNMQEFSRKLTEAVPQIPMGSTLKETFGVMSQMDGFPVVTREYEDGKFVRERFLSSAETVSFSPDHFSPPKGYKEKEFIPSQGR